jgi:hypothetical protein
MKTFALVFLSLFMTKSCQDKKTTSEQTPAIVAVTSENTPQKEENTIPGKIEPIKENTEQKGKKVEYEANTRGFFTKIIFENNTISISKDRNNPDKGSVVTMTSKELAELTKLLDAIQLKTLVSLKWPSEARFYDGAAHANLTVTSDGQTYVGPGFDHGNPPAEIAKFIQKLLSIAVKE